MVAAPCYLHDARFRMQLHPTRATFHVALAGASLVAVGVASRMGGVAAFGGAMVLAIAIGRAIARGAVTRLRAAGFEMLWSAPRRVARTARGGEVVLSAELRNRGVDDARGVAIRAISSSWLETKVEPAVVDLPASTTVTVAVTVRAKRVGRWGLHGMALEVRGTPAGGEGLYEVPLMFSNPFGIEVFPRALHAMLQSPRGGRSRRVAEAGRPSMLAGEGDELRELREHVPGDPFKRIAWKASARRGQLVVREMEREERDVVWFVLDASVELWSGEEGRAPLDEGVDEIAALSVRHLQRGDHVGLIVAAARLRAWITPAGGAAHGSRIAAALASTANTVDADRCDLDEYEVAQRVAEHARPLDARGLTDLPKSNLDMLAARAEMLRARAPFAPRLPYARTPRERTFRHYLASFGIEVPPRTDGERERTEVSLADALTKLCAEKQRPSIVHVWAPPPPLDSAVVGAVRKLRGRRVQVRWSVPPFEASIGEEPGSAVRDVVEEAVRIRARASRVRGEDVLRKMGVVRVPRHAIRNMSPSHTPDIAAPPDEQGKPPRVWETPA
jgi:uncharacterized protein (DUF58 family)